MKIVYNQDTKRMQDINDYSTLVKEAAKVFDIAEDFAGSKFYYVDHEGDVISVTSQQDLDEALLLFPKGSLKLTLAGSQSEVKQ
jgi:hypothetical protein